jgi:hypothetical protein
MLVCDAKQDHMKKVGKIQDISRDLVLFPPKTTVFFDLKAEEITRSHKKEDGHLHSKTSSFLKGVNQKYASPVKSERGLKQFKNNHCYLEKSNYPVPDLKSSKSKRKP